MLLEEIINLNSRRPKPNQLSKNNKKKFKFKIGDYVRHIDRPNTTGTIVDFNYLHENPDEKHFGNFQWFLKNDDKVNSYDDYLEAFEQEGMNPFAKIYKIHWNQDNFVGVEYEDTLKLTPKRFTPKIIKKKGSS